MAKVRLDDGNLNRLMRSLRSGMRNLSFSGPFGAMFKQWGARYLAEQRRRYNKNSRGGGDWPPLAESTKRRRKKARRGYGRRPRQHSILRDTGTLFRALTIGAAGNLFKRIRSGVRVGFGGPKRHPNGDVTIADLAEIHDRGKGRVPQRYLLYPPSQRLQAAMRRDTKRALRKILGPEKGGR